MSRRGWTALFWLFLALGLALRLGAAGWTLSHHGRALTTFDSQSYQLTAQSLYELGRFASSPQEPDNPEWQRTPGYPLFLAAQLAAWGQWWRTLPWTQAVVSWLAMLAACGLARRLFGPRAAALAGALLCLDLVGLSLNQYVLSETLFTGLFTLALVWGGWSAQDGWSWPRALGLGLLLALATHVRPVTLYLIWPLALLVAWQARGLGWRRAVGAVVALLVPWALLVGGWQVRNWALKGAPEFSAIAAVNLLEYRAAGALGLKHGRPFWEEGDRLSEEVDRLQHLELSHDDGRVRLQKKLAMEVLLANPGWAALSAAQGAARMLLGPGRELAEGWLESPLAWWTLVPLGYLATLAGYVGVLLWLWSLWRDRRPPGPAEVLICLGLAYLVAVSSGPEAYSRFREPLTPLLCLLAGAGLGRPGPWRRPGADG